MVSMMNVSFIELLILFSREIEKLQTKVFFFNDQCRQTEVQHQVVEDLHRLFQLVSL